jgi:hypothetical protein
MIKALVALISLLPGLAFAVICKSIDADGVVSYSDVAAAECQQKVKLPEYSRYAPRVIEPAPADESAAGRAARFTGYKSIAIVRPKSGGSVRNNEGRVDVSITLEPALQDGHRVTLIVDGRPLSSSFDGLAIELNGVQRGDHKLLAVVSDGSGKRLIESSAVTFTMRQASRLESPSQPDDGPPDDGDDAPDPPVAETPAAPYDPAYDTDYRPTQQPANSAQGGGVTSTPGRTNPAFAPSYNP